VEHQEPGCTLVDSQADSQWLCLPWPFSPLLTLSDFLPFPQGSKFKRLKKAGGVGGDVGGDDDRGARRARTQEELQQELFGAGGQQLRFPPLQLLDWLYSFIRTDHWLWSQEGAHSGRAAVGAGGQVGINFSSAFHL
jgi:hypothetical protein